MSVPPPDAVMARRRTALDELDYFPTPPWASRAFLFETLLPIIASSSLTLGAPSVWEPAAGGGHMAAVLAEGCARVHATDVHDWGPGFAQGSFIGGGLEALASCPFTPDWIVTNPPFKVGVEFARRALETATHGVALLCRTGWVEGVGRHEQLYGPRPPSFIVQYSERVPMVKERWDPDATTATAYAWFVWCRDIPFDDTRFRWLPPGRERRWTRPDDAAHFAGRSVSPERLKSIGGAS